MHIARVTIFKPKSPQDDLFARFREHTAEERREDEGGACFAGPVRQGASASSTTLQASLRGRSRGNCHPGELGAALRRLGFERRRNWRGADGFRAIWRKEG